VHCVFRDAPGPGRPDAMAEAGRIGGMAGDRSTNGEATMLAAWYGWVRRGGAVAALLLAALAAIAAPAAGVAQTGKDSLPFQVGEELTYRVSVARLGGVGRGVMRVEGPEVVRGRQTLLLGLEVRGRLGLMGIEDRAHSWFDPQRRHSLRYHKVERNPVNSRSEEVEMYPAERRWVDANGGGAMLTDAPLDELSFLYHIRTLPLRPGDAYTFTRHFDTERNPVTVRVIGRDTIDVPAGRFAVIVVEMRVRDGERFKGQGTIRLYLSDDAQRAPVRMQSHVPVVGRATLSLESSGRPIAARIPHPGPRTALAP
jgi:hypothetical protein